MIDSALAQIELLLSSIFPNKLDRNLDFYQWNISWFRGREEEYIHVKLPESCQTGKFANYHGAWSFRKEGRMAVKNAMGPKPHWNISVNYLSPQSITKISNHTYELDLPCMSLIPSFIGSWKSNILIVDRASLMRPDGHGGHLSGKKPSLP